MNKAVMKLPLMLGVVGAIAFAAATPSWAAEKGQTAAGAGAQAGTQTKTGSSAKMSTGTGTKAVGHAESNAGMKTGHVSKSSKLSSKTQMGTGRTHLSSKERGRTRTRGGERESFGSRTRLDLREPRFRNRNDVGFGVEAGYQDTGFAYGYGAPGYGYGYAARGRAFSPLFPTLDSAVG